MIQDDPELKDIDAVILDEFHERNLFSDLSYAFLLDVQENLRPDLRILIMSATPEKELLKGHFQGAGYLESRGRMFPVDLECLPGSPDNRIQPVELGRAVQKGLDKRPGDVLVFLPGEGEIHRMEAHLKSMATLEGCRIVPLYGRLSFREQERAFEICSDRKIILATSIAETSLTIPGVTAVVDSGLERRPVFNRHSGLTKLETRRISRASADQRAGRAGRVREGLCIRLWDESTHASLDAFRDPEIISSDLSSLVLETSLWGCPDGEALQWLQPPPRAHYYQARDLLTMLQALDGDGRLSSTGRRMVSMGLHPRLAHLVLEGRRKGLEQTACCLAAFLSERDWFGRGKDSDIHSRLYALKNRRDSHNPVVRRILSLWESLLRGKIKPEELQVDAAGELLLTAFPDRIGRQREGLRYHLSGGGECRLAEGDSLQGFEYILAVETGGSGQVPLVFLSVPLSKDALPVLCRDIIRESEQTRWDESKNRLKTVGIRSIGHLILSETPRPEAAGNPSLEEMKKSLRKKSLAILPWGKEDKDFLSRCRFVSALDHSLRPESWPDFDEEKLINGLEQWFLPLLIKGRLEGSLKDGLLSLLSWDQQTYLKRQVPERIQVPSGSRIRIDYSDPEQPALDVRIQELFGLEETPLIAGSVPLLIRLLNPARRPIQLTRDLKSFWENTYPEVRKELRGRYPKHYWPENPYEAEATRRVRPR